MFDPFALSAEKLGDVFGHVSREILQSAPSMVGLHNDLDDDGTEFHQQHQ